MWKNFVERGEPQIWRMGVACWLPKVTNTHSEYVILISCALQQQMQERASILRYTCIACGVIDFNVLRNLYNLSMKGRDVSKLTGLVVFFIYVAFNSYYIFIINIINIKDLTLWSVPSPELQLLAPTLLRSSNCSLSLWSVVVWFQRDSVLWHSLQVWKPVPSVSIYLV